MTFDFADAKYRPYNPFAGGIPYAPEPAPSSPLQRVQPPSTPPLTRSLPSTQALGALDDIAARQDWAKRTRAAWLDEDLANIARKNADDLADIAAHKAAQRKGLGVAAGKVVGGLGLFYAGLEVMDFLAPGVHGWLRGGWRGADGTGRPLTPGVVSPGNCIDAWYNVRFRARRSDGYTENSGSTFQGQFLGVVLNPPGRWGWFGAVRRPWNPGAIDYLGWLSPLDPFDWVVTVTSIERGDGQPDNCVGQPQPDPVTTAPNPVTTSPYIGAPDISTRTRPRSAPETAPRTPVRPILTGSPFERIEDPFTAPRTAPEFSLPNPSDPVTTAPTFDRPPKNPTPPLTEADGCDPCQVRTGDKLDEIRDTLEEIKEALEEDKPPQVQGIEWRYPIVRCIDGEVSIEQRLIYVAQLPPDSYREEIRQMANAAATVCVGVAPASVPDYWPVKVGAGRPQLELTFRQAGTSGYLSICIPHPASDEPWTEDLFGDYWSGNFSGMVRLSDNSQIIVNCDSVGEANRVLDVAIGLVNPSMLPSDPDRRVVERRGMVVKRTKRLLRKVSYFSQGQRDLRPDWTRRLPSFSIL